MFHIVLYEPEIPPNTGNIMRLCYNLGMSLHLIEPLGFDISEKKLRRAAIDYYDKLKLSTYKNFEEFTAQHKEINLYSLTTKADKYYHQIEFQANDFFIFGPESRGLPNKVIDACGKNKALRLPMQTVERSINLSNCVSVVAYEAYKSINFQGLK